MTAYNLEEIVRIINGELIETDTSDNKEIRFLSFDSRTILSGKETLFFAFKSERNDGHRYIADAYNKGVVSFVVEVVPDNYQTFEKASFLLVNDSLSALQKLAAYHRSRFSYPVVGITGSNGKTIVKEWLAELLSPEFHIIRSPRSYNSQIGNPLSVWLMDDRFNLALFEAGISKPDEMENLESILRPDIGLFTHLGTAHLENFRSEEELVDEKLKLFKNSKLLIYCSDFELLRKKISNSFEAGKPELFCWSVKDPGADLYVTSKQVSRDNTIIKGIYHSQQIELTLPFTDDAHIENAIHCWAYMLATGYRQGTFEKRFQMLTSIAMRLELKKGINGCTIINDSYNSDTASIINALDFLQQQSDFKKRKHTVIISDILQSGEDPDILYNEVGNFIRLRNIDRLIGIGTEISKHSDLFQVVDKQFYPDTDEFLIHFREGNFRNEVVLLKGARAFRFDRISALLQEKAHQTVMEIDLDAMVHNLNFYRQRLNSGTKIMAMVKAFSYGTGSVEIAKVLQFRRVDYLAVAIADEGVELRNNGIEIPIIVMNPEEHSFDTMIENRLEPNIYRFKLLEQFDEALRHNAVTNFPVHLKVDTGMKRLGFDNAEDLKKVAGYIQRQNTMFVRSIFSHLAVSEDPANDEFTIEQFRKFNNYCRIVTGSFDYEIMRHILNSSGIERFPEMQLEMVRLGIGLYGVSPIFQNELRNVATLKTTISQIRTVEHGETIGYGRRGVASDTLQIAVLPIGYADGLNRRLSNGIGKVIISGSRAPIIGSISMDMCMVDITGLNAKEGDRVIVFGEELPVNEVAAYLDTIPYEVLTSIGHRVKRVYFME